MIAASVLGVGAWAPGLEGWPAWVAGEPSTPSGSRPVATILPAAERRRAPDGVSVALAVAQEAVAMAGCDASALPTVFASAYGDLAIVDYLCATLAADPLAVSPTRFHHSVHNAAAGYWSIATGAGEAATAIAAGDATVANGLLEALVQVAARAAPVLLVLFDTPASGPLACAAPNTALFGCAFVLGPPDATSLRIVASVEPRASTATLPEREAWRALAATSPSAAAVALLEALARRGEPSPGGAVDLPLGPAATLRTRVVTPPGPASRVG